MEKNIADVSIVVANYNNGKYISKLITSVVESAVLPKELIIIDDGSRDDSVSRLESYSRIYSFIKLIKFSVNQGFANALNQGLDAATAKYIFRVDSDDYVSPTRIQEQVNFLESHSSIDIVGSNIAYFNSNSGEIVFKSNVPLDHNTIYKTFRTGNCGIIHGSMAGKSSVIKQFRYNQENVPAEDYELFSLILKSGYQVANLPEALTFVRIHPNSVSNNLPFETIRKTFQLQNIIWNIKTNYFTVKRIHLYLFYYRRFLFCKGIERYGYLFLAVLFNPMKLLARMTH
jgi:glycosyltransferase involved in cell wall biosynthesis